MKRLTKKDFPNFPSDLAKLCDLDNIKSSGIMVPLVDYDFCVSYSGHLPWWTNKEPPWEVTWVTLGTKFEKQKFMGPEHIAPFIWGLILAGEIRQYRRNL